MNFIENLSLSSGLKSRKPFLVENFFPVVPDHYITLHTENHSSKQWDHIQEFIDTIKPFLAKKNIKIIELGWNDLSLNNIDYSIKNTDPRNTAYIISKSMLHVGVENFLTQLSSHYDVPCVSLYSNTSPEVFAPAWGSKLDYRSNCIFPHLPNHKPTYMGEENPKTINKIPPEMVLSKCLDALNISHDFNKREVLHMGPASHAKCLEVVPDFSPSPSFFPQSIVNVRMDYYFDEAPLETLASNRKISIVFDKPVNLSLIKRLSPNIEALFIRMNDSFDENYIKGIQSLGRQTVFILPHHLKDSDIRTKFFDIKIVSEEKKEKKDLDNHEKICDTTRYKSSKMIFSKNKEYPTKAAWKAGLETAENQTVIDTDDFWEESDYIKLYNIHDKENSETK